MAWEVPTEPDDSGNEFDPTGSNNFNNIDKAGRYHVEVSGAFIDPEDQAVIDYIVLGGDNPDQVDKTFRDWFSPSKKSRNRILAFAYATGISSEVAAADAKAKGQPVAFELDDAIGQQLIIGIENGTNNKGNPRLECNWDICGLTDEKAKGVAIAGVEASSTPFERGGGGKAGTDTGEGDLGDLGL